MLLNAKNPSHVTTDGCDLPTREELTYIGNVVKCDGETGSEMTNRSAKKRFQDAKQCLEVIPV